MQCIYIPHISLIDSWRFTILLILGEIGRQLVKAPMAAAISPYFDLTYPPTQPMHGEIDHHTGIYVPYSVRQVCGCFNVPC